jgi:hypothetical protein
MFATMTDDTKTWWSDQIKSLGFPIVVCVALMYGGYNILTVFITPVFQKQMQTLEVVTNTQEKMVEKLETMATDISVHKQILTELTTSQKDALLTLKEIEKNTSK